MGFYDSSTIGVFRYTKDGRRLFVKRYLVADADVDRVKFRIRTSTILSPVLVVVGCGVARDLWGEAWSWLGLPLILPIYLLLRYWIASGLSVVVVPEAELEPVDRRALSLAEARATGRPALLTLLLVAIGTTALGGLIAFTDGVWYGWCLLIVMAYCSVSIFRQIRQLSGDRSEEAQPNPRLLRTGPEAPRPPR